MSDILIGATEIWIALEVGKEICVFAWCGQGLGR